MKHTTLTRLTTPALALLLAFALPGCGNNNTPAPNTGRAAPNTDTAGSSGGNEEAAARRDRTATDTPPPADHAADPDPNAGRVATYQGQPRQPFPEEGERLTRHLASTRMSDHNAFHEPIAPDSIPDVVPWQDAGRYVGHTITVEGRIVDIGRTSSGSVNFLNFHEQWQGKFYMVVFEDLADTLDGGVEATFLDKLVRVRGLVEPHRGRPQIKIESMDQVEFVEE